MSFMSWFTMSPFGAHVMPALCWIFEFTTPNAPAIDTTPMSGCFSMPMTFAPASAAARAAATPDNPRPITSTSQSFSSATSAGGSGFVRNDGTYAVGSGMPAPPAAPASAVPPAAASLPCGAQPARPAAPAATAAVAPRPRNARRDMPVVFVFI